MNRNAEEPIIEVWVTKYALTAGIQHYAQARVCARINDQMIDCGRHRLFHGEGKDWHRSEAAALEHADKMRIAKLASLKRQMAKIERMTFKITEGT